MTGVWERLHKVQLNDLFERTNQENEMGRPCDTYGKYESCIPLYMGVNLGISHRGRNIG
jgi:hypothetical protein